MNKIGADYYESTLDFAAAVYKAICEYFGLNTINFDRTDRLQLPDLKASIMRRIPTT